MSKNLLHVLGLFEQSDWMLEEGFYERMAQVLARRGDGVQLSDEEVAARIAAEGQRQARPFDPQQIGSVAVVPIMGVISKYASLVEQISAGRGTSCETIRARFRQARGEPSVRTILFRIDSPGGAVAGIDELAGEIYQARGEKRIVAIAEDMCASAAYYLACQAHAVYATPSTHIGSIGVMAGVLDAYRAYENEGVSMIVVKSNERKGAGVTGTHINEAQKREWHKRIMGLYDLFVAAVARGRGLDAASLVPKSPDDEGIADGRVFLAEEAKQLRLIDGIATFDALIAKFNSPETSGGRAGATAGGIPSIGLETKGNDNMPEPKTNETNAAGGTGTGPQPKVHSADDERLRCQRVSKVLAAYPDLLEKALADGDCDETKAKAMKADALQAQLGEQDARIAALTTENRTLKGLVGPDGAQGTALPETDSTDHVGPATWEEALAEFDQKYPTDPVKAQKEAMRAHKDLYVAWRKKAGIDA